MAENETRVVYKAIADFSALSRAARQAKRDLAELRAEEAALNASSLSGSKGATSAVERHAKAVGSDTNAMHSSSEAHRDHNSAVKEGAAASGALGAATSKTNTVLSSANNTIKQAASHHGNLARNTNASTRALIPANAQMSNFQRGVQRAVGPIEKINNQFDRLGKRRPKLTPPFIALIPLIAGVLALINPLIAGIGALGGAGIGLVSVLGQIGGAALGVIPALFSLLSVVAALKVGFSGIGGAFKAFGAAKKAKTKAASSGGAPKQAELTLQEKINRAQEAYRRSIQDVKFAQDDLNDARKGYIKRLKDLQRAVDDSALSALRAAANSRLAYEEYQRTMADPGASQGDRMAAEAAYKEALEEEQKVGEENKKNAEDLAKMKKEGMKADREVIMAQRALTDAINRQRDAQIDLINARRGGSGATGAAATAENAYLDALNKLSPSARKFVEALVAMDGAWQKVKKTVQESFFSKIVGDTSKLKSMLPTVQSLLSDTAGALGDVAHQFLSMITSPEWKSDLVLLGKANIPVIKNIGAGLNTLWGIFKDLAVIAMPFLTELTKGFKKGTENIAAMVNEARKSGSLGKWLMGDKENGTKGVLGTLRQWWEIIKNIGKTIFNYAKGAEAFATWISDGIQKATEGWLKTSEEASKKDSPFQKWLENIKPLLSEISRLFGTFFSWFTKESGDVTNIKVMTEIFRKITDDLGPKLAKLLDSFSKAEIGPKFIDTLTKLIDLIVELVSSDATAVFFDVLNSLLDVLNMLLKMPVVGDILKGLAVGFAAIAALSFVAKFTGIENFIGWLLKLQKAGSLAAMVTRLRAAFSGNWGMALGPKAALPTTVPGGKLPGGGYAPVGPMPIKGGQKLPGGGYAPIGPNVAKGGALGKAGTVLKGAGGIAGMIASIVGSLVGDAISNAAPEGAAGASQRTGGNMLSGASTGAGIGALIGSFFAGIGAVPGAAIGAGVGATAAYAGGSEEDRAQMNKDIAKWFEDTAKGISSWWTDTVVPEWSRGIERITGWWNDGVVVPFTTSATNISTWWNDSVVIPFTTAATNIATWWNDQVVVPMSNLSGTIGEIWDMNTAGIKENWDLYVVQPLTAWATSVGQGWNDNVVVPFNTWITSLGQWWNDNIGVPFMLGIDGITAGWTAFVNGITAGWNTNIVVPFRTAANNVANWWNASVVGPFRTAANNVSNWWNASVVTPFRTAANNVANWWSANVVTPFRTAADNVGRWWSQAIKGISEFNPITAFNNWLRNRFGLGEQGKHNGGVIERAGGGGVPGRGNSDTVPAMLTPGEFVVRKAIVDRVGLENLAKLNSGIMSYSAMLQKAMSVQGKPKESTGTLSFFDGGGLVPSNNSGPTLPGFGGPGSSGVSGQGGSGQAPSKQIVIENLNVINPKAETVPESLHSTVRKLNYVFGGREQ